MCGIAGFWSKHGQASREDIQAMTDRLAHRGPDGQGVFLSGPFALGHRRLSIIDLSGGAQPLHSSDGGVVIAFNGEAYNYIELRAELEARGVRFGTRSDTEVVLELYRALGTAAFARIDGMFARAILDLRKNRLVLARDRLGEKPLFMYDGPDVFAFGSELKALAFRPGMPRAVDLEALSDFLSLNYVPGAKTLLQGATRLPAGTWLEIGPGARREGRYFSPDSMPADPLARRGEAELIARLDRLLADSVRLRLRSDVPVGIFLSGGVDSSLVAWKAQEAGRLDRAYCAGFSDDSYDESPFAGQVARELGIPLETVPMRPVDPEMFDRLVWASDEPSADSSAVPVFQLSERAACKNKVVLGGDGGDELFGGYLTYSATALAAKLSRIPGVGLLSGLYPHIPVSESKVSLSFKLRRFLRGLSMLPGEAHLSWNGGWTAAEKNPLLSAEVRSRLKGPGTFSKVAGGHGVCLSRPSLRELQNLDLQEYLCHDILAKVDRMSMASGLEVRAPFLYPPLMSFALSLPDGLKLGRARRTKHLSKELLARRFSRKLADRPKQGFSIPAHAWTRGNLRGLIEERLSAAALKRAGLLDAQAVRAVVDAHISGRAAFGFELWGLLVLATWHAYFIERSLPPPVRAKAACGSAR